MFLCRKRKTTDATLHDTTSSCTECDQSWYGWYCATCNRTVPVTSAYEVASEFNSSEDRAFNLTSAYEVVSATSIESSEPGESTKPSESTQQIPLRVHPTNPANPARIYYRNTLDSASSESSKSSQPSESTKRMRLWSTPSSWSDSSESYERESDSDESEAEVERQVPTSPDEPPLMCPDGPHDDESSPL